MSGEYKQQYNGFKQNPAQFWLEQSKNIPWYKTPTKAYTQDDDGLYHWFSDGQLNTSFFSTRPTRYCRIWRANCTDLRLSSH